MATRACILMVALAAISCASLPSGWIAYDRDRQTALVRASSVRLERLSPNDAVIHCEIISESGVRTPSSFVVFAGTAQAQVPRDALLLLEYRNQQWDLAGRDVAHSVRHITASNIALLREVVETNGLGTPISDRISLERATQLASSALNLRQTNGIAVTGHRYLLGWRINFVETGPEFTAGFHPTVYVGDDGNVKSVSLGL